MLLCRIIKALRRMPRVMMLLAVLTLRAWCSMDAQIMWNMDNMSVVKEDEQYRKLREALIKKGDKAAEAEAVTVMTPGKRFTADPHSYVTIAPYTWPDAANIGGPYVTRDGLRNPEYYEYDITRLTALRSNLMYMAWALYFTGDEKFADAINRQLRVWFLDDATFMRPHLEYAQIIPGRNGNKGQAGGIIEAYFLNDILESIRLAASTGHVADSTMAGLRQWFGDFGQWMLTSANGQKERAAGNNHGIAYDVTLLNIALFTGNKALRKRLTRAFASTRLDVQIAADGSQPAELRRNNAFDYSVYNLTHIIDFCVIQESTGNHYYRKHKNVIDSAFAYLYQYIGNEEKFPYKELKDWQSIEQSLRRQARRLLRLQGADISVLPPGEPAHCAIIEANMAL